MNDFLKDTIGKWTEPPPMPPEAFPAGTRLLPGGHEALQLAWQGMWYDGVRTGVILGVLLILTVIIAIIARGHLVQSIGDYLKRIAANA